MCEVSTCKTVTDIRKINGGGRHELRRNLSSFKGWKKSERFLLQFLQCQEERDDKQDTEPERLLSADEGWNKGTQNSREDR